MNQEELCTCGHAGRHEVRLGEKDPTRYTFCNDCVDFAKDPIYACGHRKSDHERGECKICNCFKCRAMPFEPCKGYTRTPFQVRKHENS